MNDKMIITAMKSELFDLWNSAENDKTYAQWIEVLKVKLSNYFGIKRSAFLIYNKELDCFTSDKRIAQFTKGIPAKTIIDQQKPANILTFKEKGFEFTKDYLLLVDLKKHPLGILLVDDATKWKEFVTSGYFEEFKVTVSSFILKIKDLKELSIKQSNFRTLFKVTEYFNATMESHLILDRLMDEIHKLFPILTVNLLLTKDQESLSYPYKQFDQTKERRSTVEAFLSGKLTNESIKDLNVEFLNIPIRGKQGIYGLVQIKNTCPFLFTTTQKKFLCKLAETAGSALENANLYDQSHRLIEDLRLVNETSHKLNSGMHFDEMIHFLRQQLVNALAPDEIGFIFIDENQSKKVIGPSTAFFTSENGKRYIKYVDDSIRRGRPALFEADLSETEKGDLPHKAIIGLPIQNQDETIGYVICLHEEAYFFSFEQYKMVQSLVGHSSLAISNLLLRNQLRSLAEKDHLTGLYARRYLDHAVQKSIRKDRRGTFILFDIDDFKKVNDGYGHNVGDEVLKQVSTFIMKEIPNGAIAARWGGEEIAIYLSDVNPELGKDFCERLVAEIPKITLPSITISAGITNWTMNEKIKLTELLKNADEVLYEAKKKGKNQFVVYN